MKNIVLSMFIFVVFIECYSCQPHTDRQKDYLKMNPTFYSTLSKILNKEYVNKIGLASDSLSYLKYFFVLKFIKADTILCYSLWVQEDFPKWNKTDDGWVRTDTTNMYYYCINGNSLIIIDYPDSHGHGLYQQTTNEQAIEMMHRAEKFSTPTLRHKDPIRTSYWVKRKDSIERIIPLMPPRYKNEKE